MQENTKYKINFLVPKKTRGHPENVFLTIAKIVRRLIVSGTTGTAVDTNKVIKEVHGVDICHKTIRRSLKITVCGN